MGKKTKVGKSRRDKFYQLAKETGYRSRAAFKLIQLNRKFEFLQKSRVVIDLCAAPGGWLQVAAENTPVSSLIVGVDLVSIRPVPRTITLQEDITTDKCRQALKKELQTWKADCVLNDGAPNVGKSWVHDAFQQAELTLSALKLATEFLRKGGWFVTKVFRSKDYFSLLWVFQQLFKHVHATKPQASRNESAEIFVVCQHFLAPDKLDPKFLDPKYVFKDVGEEQPQKKINLIHPEKKQRHREGYAEGDYTLYHRLNATEFLHSEDFMEKLAASSEIVLDSEQIANHPATTTEIKECCKDIGVLGRKDIKNLFSWRKTLLKDIKKPEMEEEQNERNGIKAAGKDDEALSESEQEEQQMQEVLAKVQEEERLKLKRKLRKERKAKSKLQQRKDMKMIISSDRLDYGDDSGVFSLAKIRSKQQLDQVQEGDLSFMDGDIVEEEEEEPSARKRQKLMEAYDKDSKSHLDTLEYSSDEEGQEEPEFDEDDLAAEDMQESGDSNNNNPLVVELESQDSRARSRTASWFSKEVFEDLEKDDDEDIEMEALAADYQEKGGTVVGKTDDTPSKKKVHFADEKDDDNDDDDDESDSDYDVDEMMKTKSAADASKHKLDKKAGFEVARAESDAQKLDPEGLAIGAAMVHSKKRRREIIEGAYHRYMFNDEGLPEWFTKEEEKHCKKQRPVTKEEMQEYMLKTRSLNARPIKKIAEAKARKKKKMVKRLERAKKKAEKITEDEGVSEKEKMQQIKQIYKKAGLLSKKQKEVTYVVAKKGLGKRVRRPHGVSGRFKVVDPRMKKDVRSNKKPSSKSKGKTNSRRQQRKKGKRG